MNREALQGLYEEEQRLMDEWRIRWKEQHGEYPYFNSDGIVDYERWGSLPDGKRILVVLKETNGLEADLVKFLQNGGNHRTWNNVTRWARMLLEYEYMDYVCRRVRADMLKNLAVMNLKKYAGGPRANRREVKREALLDVDLIKRQILLYRPNVILAGGWGLTADFIHDEVFHDESPWQDPGKRKNKEGETELWYYRTARILEGERTEERTVENSGEEKRKGGETLVISMPHPNRASKRWTLELGKVPEK